jgi:mRNA interferase MazF
MARPYVPQRGEMVGLQFAPQAGRGEAGHWAALVVSPGAYNEKVGLALVCPITRQVKGYPFEVVLPPGLKAGGAILADQLRCLDWRARHATLIGEAPAEVLNETLAKIATLVR